MSLRSLAPLYPECTYEPIFDHVAWAGDPFALAATSTHWGVLRHYLTDGTVACSDVVGDPLDDTPIADGNDGAWLWVEESGVRTLLRARPP